VFRSRMMPTQQPPRNRSTYSRLPTTCSQRCDHPHFIWLSRVVSNQKRSRSRKKLFDFRANLSTGPCSISSTTRQHQQCPPQSAILSYQALPSPSMGRSRHPRKMCSRPCPSTLGSPYHRKSLRIMASITPRPIIFPVRANPHFLQPEPFELVCCARVRRRLRRLQHTAA